MKPGRRWINYGWRWRGETRKFTDVRNQPSAIGDNGRREPDAGGLFTTLCVDARSQHDYIALSRLFHTVMLFDVPVMTRLMESEARRFIALVDEFYERHVKLVVSAEVPLYEIYQGDRLKFEFQRCLSRLQEMQSEEYLKREHLAG